jgi:hypothetical protein
MTTYYDDVKGVSNSTFDTLAEHTEVDRAACKCLIFAMIYGGPVLAVCKQYKLGIEEIVMIRNTFNDIMEGRL